MRLALALSVLALAGCLEGPPPQAGMTVEESVRAHVQAALDRDVDAMMSFYADDWLDLGGGAACADAASSSERGSCGGDGTPDTKEERRARIAAFLASDEWREKTAGKTIDDVLDWPGAEYRQPGAYGEEWDEGSWKERWTPGPADVLVFVPPKEGSPFFDGWFGFYREAEARWVQVAGD